MKYSIYLPGSFIFVATLLLLSSHTHAATASLTPLDTIILQCKQSSSTTPPSLPQLSWHSPYFYSCTSNNSLFHQYNREGQCTQHFKVYLHDKQQQAMYPLTFQVTDHYYVFARYNNVVLYDKQKEFDCYTQLQIRPNKAIFHQRLATDPLFLIEESAHQIFIPLKYWWPDMGYWEQMTTEDYYNTYNQYGLLASFSYTHLIKQCKEANSPPLPLENFIGSRHNIYQEKQYLPHLDGWNWALSSKENRIYLNEWGHPTIKHYDMSGDLTGKFGRRGQHLHPTDTIHQLPSFTKASDSNKLLQYSYQLTSPQYEYLFIDNDHQLIYRTYRAPLPDTTTPGHSLSRQLTLLRQRVSDRPTYLQIYDLTTHQLLADIPVPRSPFKILRVNSDTLWVNGGWHKKTGSPSSTTLLPTVYKYKIRLPATRKDN